jgi:hypothetical protein
MAIHIPSQNSQVRNTVPPFDSRKPEYGAAPRPSLNSPDCYLLNQNQLQQQPEPPYPQWQAQPYPQEYPQHLSRPSPEAPVFLPTQLFKPSKPKSRFRCKNEVSRHLLITNPNHGQWLISRADHVCEETLVVLSSVKNAKIAFLSFGAVTVQVQQELWNKVTAIEGYCDEAIQAHWVKSVIAELSRYWTAVLRKAGNAVLPTEQHGEFMRLIDEAHKLIETQASEAGKIFMSTQQILTLDQLVNAGASVNVSFPVPDLTDAEKEAMMKASQNSVSNEDTPLPTIDPSMLDKPEEDCKPGFIKRTVTAIKEKAVAVKNTVYKFAAISYFWKLVAFFVLTMMVGIAIVVLGRRQAQTTNFSTGDTFGRIYSAVMYGAIVAGKFAAFAAGVAYETVKIAAIKVGNVAVAAFNAIKNWFSKSGSVVTDTATTAFA